MRWSSTEMIGYRRGRGSGSGSRGMASVVPGAADDATGPGAGVGAVALDDLTVDDGGDEPVGALQHALGPGREVVHHLDGLRRDGGDVERR